MARTSSTNGSGLKIEGPPTEKDVLDTLTSDKAMAILHDLLKRHPELQSEVDELARNTEPPSSIEGIAEEVFHAVTSIDLDELNDRAGSHSWGYVEPSEAAYELLEESLQDLIDDMKHRAGLGPKAGAEGWGGRCLLGNCAGALSGTRR